MSRLPIRIRLTLAFTLVMAVVLAGMSFFVYARVGSTLLASIDQSLRGQTVDVAHLDRGRLDLDASVGGGIAEVLRPGGAIVTADPPGLPRLLDADTIRRVAAGERVLRSQHLAGLRERWRVLAKPTTVRGRPGALIVARPLAGRDETLDHLLDELFVAGPLALLLAAVAGYGLAAAALRPVERMRAARGGDLGLDAGSAPAGASGPGRDLPAGRDAERDARPARGRPRARAALRG